MRFGDLGRRLRRAEETQRFEEDVALGVKLCFGAPQQPVSVASTAPLPAGYEGVRDDVGFRAEPDSDLVALA